MIKLSKMCDHALVLILALGTSSESRSSLAWAKQAGLPVATTTKLLKKMCKAGLCASQRGKDGGYGLVKSASEITVLSVIEAIEGPLSFSDCGVAGRGCSKSTGCVARRHVVKIGVAIRESLRAMTVHEMGLGSEAAYGQ